MKSAIRKYIALVILICICINISACSHKSDAPKIEKDPNAAKYYLNDGSFDILGYINLYGSIMGKHEDYITAEINGWNITIDFSETSADLEKCDLVIGYGNLLEGFKESFIINSSCYNDKEIKNATCIDVNKRLYIATGMLEDFSRIVPVLVQQEANEKCPICGTGIIHLNSGKIKS